MFDYQVLRSHRKTLSLQVKHGQVFVRAPYHLDDQFICAFIEKKSNWLNKKIKEQNLTVDLCCDFTHGSSLFLLGQQVVLNITFTNSSNLSKDEPTIFLSGLAIDSEQLIIRLSKRQKQLDAIPLSLFVKKQLEQFLKEKATNIILPKVAYFSELTQLSPKGIKIRQYRARWGSCNSKGELSFNYLLMMLPTYVIDYVIVHELCHLRHLNHSKDFWRLVEGYFPEYLKAKAWIKTHQSALHWRLPSHIKH